MLWHYAPGQLCGLARTMHRSAKKPRASLLRRASTSCDGCWDMNGSRARFRPRQGGSLASRIREGAVARRPAELRLLGNKRAPQSCANHTIRCSGAAGSDYGIRGLRDGRTTTDLTARPGRNPFWDGIPPRATRVRSQAAPRSGGRAPCGTPTDPSTDTNTLTSAPGGDVPGPTYPLRCGPAAGLAGRLRSSHPTSPPAKLQKWWQPADLSKKKKNEWSYDTSQPRWSDTTKIGGQRTGASSRSRTMEGECGSPTDAQPAGGAADLTTVKVIGQTLGSTPNLKKPASCGRLPGLDGRP